jgi:hypothetical protein
VICALAGRGTATDEEMLSGPVVAIVGAVVVGVRLDEVTVVGVPADGLLPPWPDDEHAASREPVASGTSVSPKSRRVREDVAILSIVVAGPRGGGSRRALSKKYSVVRTSEWRRSGSR